MVVLSAMATMSCQTLRQIRHQVGCRKYLILLVSATAGVGTLIPNTLDAKTSAIQAVIVIVFIYALFTPAIKTRKVVSKKCEEKTPVLDGWMNDKRAAKSTEKQSKKKAKRKHVAAVAIVPNIVATPGPQNSSQQSTPTPFAMAATAQVTELAQEDDEGFELVTKRIRPQRKKPDNTHIAEVPSKVERSTATKKPAAMKGYIATKKPIATTKPIDTEKLIEESVGCKEWDLDAESENVEPSAKPIAPKSMVEIAVPQPPSTELVVPEQSVKPVLSLQTTKSIAQPVKQSSTEQSGISEPSVPENSDPALQRQIIMPPSELPLAHKSTIVSPRSSSESSSDASIPEVDSLATTPEIKSTEVEQMGEYGFPSKYTAPQEHVLKTANEHPAIDAEPEVIAPKVSEHNMETSPVEDKHIVSPISESATNEETDPTPEETVPVPEERISTPQETVPVPEETVSTLEETAPSTEETTPVTEETVSTPEETVSTPEETSPALEESVLDLEEIISVRKETISIPQETVLTPEETVPAPEETVSRPEETIPAAEETIPALEETTLAPEETVPVLEETIPVPEETVSNLEETVSKLEETVSKLEETVSKLEETIPTPEETEQATATELMIEGNSLVPVSVDSIASNLSPQRTWASVVANEQTWAEMDEEDRENGIP